jgi:hypothetical protein
LHYTPSLEAQVEQPCGDLWCNHPLIESPVRKRQPGSRDEYIQVPDGTLCSASGEQCLYGGCSYLDDTGQGGDTGQGDNPTYAGACTQFDVGFIKYTPSPDKQAEQPCGDLWCNNSILGSPVRKHQPGSRDDYIQVPDGTLCSASGEQCLNGNCSLP